MFDYRITATVDQTRRQDLLAEAAAHRLAKAARTTRRTRTTRSARRARTWVWLEYRPAVRAFSGAR